MKIIANNKKAYHNYFVTDTYEAGIVLLGTEIKSIRDGKANISDAFAFFDKKNNLIMKNAHISEYKFGTQNNHEPKRNRRLLMHKKEIRKLRSMKEQKGFTIVPLKLYFKNNLVKVEIGLCKGKKKFDKREDLKKADVKRKMDTFVKNKIYRK